MLKITQIRRAEALRYLGYGQSAPDEKISALIDECEKKLLSTAVPAYTYKVFPVERDGGICIGGVFLSGNSIVGHLDGCEKAALICATLSSSVDRLIRAEEVSDMTHAVIIDNLANAMIEQVCDAAEEEISEKTKLFMTWRFSAGYGDLPLDIQGDLLRALDADKRVGVCVTGGGLMSPIKTVTAIIGLSESPIDRKKQGCESCNMKNTCKFRERGERCAD